MKHSYVDIRFSNSCFTRDYRFGLSGSTKAIKFVLGSEIMQLVEEAADKVLLKEKFIADYKKNKYLFSAVTIHSINDLGAGSTIYVLGYYAASNEIEYKINDSNDIVKDSPDVIKSGLDDSGKELLDKVLWVFGNN